MYRHKGQGGVGFEVLLFSRFIQLKGMDGIEEFLLKLIWDFFLSFCFVLSDCTRKNLVLLNLVLSEHFMETCINE